jgi:hypothetical protein
VILEGMGTVHQLRRHEIGEVSFLAAIVLGIGDDDTVAVVSESEYASEEAARAWIERQLPGAGFPEWVTRRRHGSADAFLCGQVERGYYSGHGENDWEPGADDFCWDADIVDGAICWRQRD